MNKNLYFLYALAIVLFVTAACWSTAFGSASEGGGGSWSSRSSTSQGGSGGYGGGGHK